MATMLPNKKPLTEDLTNGAGYPVGAVLPKMAQPAPGGPMINPGIPGMPNPNGGGVTTMPGGVQPINPGIVPNRPNIGPGMPAQPPSGPIIGPSIPGQQPTTAQQTSITQFGPGNDLRDNQIAPNQDVDRLKIAGDYFSQFAESTDPAYQKSIRDATKAAAANGRLGSGMLTTDYGDLAGDRSRELDLQRRGFLTQALEGTIDDARSNRDELRGERDYQTGSAQQATENAIRQRLLEEALLNGQFGRDQRITDTLGQFGGF
jgi:hypothetical protein